MYSDDLFSLAGTRALVTGGARGLGFTMAMALANAGAELHFNVRSEESRQRGIQSFLYNGISAKGYVCDVTHENEVQKLVEKLEQEGGIDILVNNAGIINRTALTNMSVDEFHSVIDTDLTGPFLMAKAVLPGMIKRGHGKIINVCGILSEVGRETAAAYASAKGGLKLLTKTIASEYGGYNIHCNGIGPGYIATSLNAALRTPEADGSQNPFDRFICAKTPAGRWGQPQDLAGPVVFLASKASNFVNGHILYVDGGFLSYLGRQS